MQNSQRILLLSAVLMTAPSSALAADASFFVEAGAARVRADSHQTGDPIAPFTPDFSETAPVLVIGSNFRLGPAPLRFSLFKVRTVEDFVSFVSPDSGAGFPFNTDLDTLGVTISLNPSWQLDDVWTADAGIGVVYLRQDVEAESSYVNYSRSDSALSAIGSAGLSYRFSPTLSSRFGVELSQDYASVTIGLRFDL